MFNTSLLTMDGDILGSRAVNYGNYIFVVGGNTYNPVSPTTTSTSAGTQIYVMDINSKTGSYKRTIPVPFGESAIAIDGDYIYVAGSMHTTGANNGATKTYRYNVITNAWEELASMPENIYEGAFIQIDRKLHLFGGFSSLSGATSLKHLTYDLDTNTWEIKTNPIPRSLRKTTAIKGPDNKIYFAGGFDSPSAGATVISDKLSIYDPATDTWSEGPVLPKPIYSPIVGTIGNRMYVMGGYNYDIMSTTNVRMTDSVLYYDFVVNAWTTTENKIDKLRCQAHAISMGSHLFVAGNRNATVVTPTSESNVKDLFYFYEPGIIIRDVITKTPFVTAAGLVARKIYNGKITPGATSTAVSVEVINGTAYKMANVIVESIKDIPPTGVSYQMSDLASNWTTGLINADKTYAGPFNSGSTMATLYLRVVTTAAATEAKDFTFRVSGVTTA